MPIRGIFFGCWASESASHAANAMTAATTASHFGFWIADFKCFTEKDSIQSMFGVVLGFPNLKFKAYIEPVEVSQIQNSLDYSVRSRQRAGYGRLRYLQPDIRCVDFFRLLRLSGNTQGKECDVKGKTPSHCATEKFHRQLNGGGCFYLAVEAVDRSARINSRDGFPLQSRGPTANAMARPSRPMRKVVGNPITP